MTGWAIVAIPEAQDPVWKYSSEKVPHMTMLFLGENGGGSDLENVVAYLQHVAESSMWPFYMHVDSRGPLGPDDADVLFFSKDKHDKAMVNSARNYLLQDDEILKAYRAIDQYPEWTPHLTMGYAATPAKEDDHHYPGFSSVNFDRIALWNGEYEGPEFKLVYPDRGEEVDMAWSDQGADFLTHFGIKGMKWGVRRADEKAKTSIPDGTVEVVSNKLVNGKVQARGGRGYAPSEDAKNSAARRQVAKESGTDALTTKELQELVTRTQLEQQYSKLTTPQNQNNMKNGMKKVKEIIEIKKTVDQLTNDPFIKESMSTIAKDFGLDKLIRKGAEALVKKR